MPNCRKSSKLTLSREGVGESNFIDKRFCGYLGLSEFVRENQTCIKSWLPFCVAFAPSRFPCWKPPILWEVLLFLKDLQCEFAVPPRQEKVGVCPLCCKNMCCASRFCTGGAGAAGSRSKQCPRARKAKC